MGFYIRQRSGVDGAKEHDLIRMDIACLKDIGQFDFIRTKFEFYSNDYPYLKIEPLQEADQYLLSFHNNNSYYPIATIRDYGGNAEDHIWFMFLIYWDKYKILPGDLYD